jgi:6-phosphofructokinase 1
MPKDLSETEQNTASALTGNLLVAQSGGLAPVGNASLAGVINEALRHEDEIIEVYGALNGIQGVLNEQLVDLAAESQQTVRALAQTPGAALGTCGLKLRRDAECDRILDVFAAHDIRYFLHIGGAEAQEAAARISARAAGRGYALRVIGIPGAVENDLPVTDHCPGYGSAAKNIAATVRETALDLAAAAQHDLVCILEVMGRNTGWLAAASVLAKRRSAIAEDAPHIVLLPEEPFNQQAFIDRVQEVLRRQKFCLVVVAEGLADAEGNPVGAAGNGVDAFGHPASAGAGEHLRGLVEQHLSGVKVSAARLGVPQRAAIRGASQSDGNEAFAAGQAAVRAAVEGQTGKMVALVREDKDGGQSYSIRTGLVPLEDVANAEKPFPRQWIGEDRMSVGYAFTKYATPLIQGEVPVAWDCGVPRFAQLSAIRVESKLDRYDTPPAPPATPLAS